MNKRTLNNMCKPMLVGQEIFVSGQAKKAECAQRRNWDIEYKIYFVLFYYTVKLPCKTTVEISKVY